MMATWATHPLGNLSRPEPNLYYGEIARETSTTHIGLWAEWLGFTSVEFLKATTRCLTPEERLAFQMKG